MNTPLPFNRTFTWGVVILKASEVLNEQEISMNINGKRGKARLWQIFNYAKELGFVEYQRYLTQTIE